MVKHVILWQLKDELSNEEKKDVKAGITSALEDASGSTSTLMSSKPGILPLRMRRR